MQRGARFKVRRVTGAQSRALARFVGCNRKAYNLALDRDLALMAAGGGRLPYCEHAKGLVALKREPATSYLAEAPSQTLQQSLMDLDRAWRNFFEGRAGRPTFRRKFRDDTMRFPQGFSLDVDGGRVRIPKVGWLPLFNKRLLAKMAKRGRALSVTMRRESGQWWVSVCFELPDPAPSADPSSQVGVDMGVAHALALSDGTFRDVGAKEAARIGRMESHVKRLQRKAARQKKGSKGRKETYSRIAKLRRRIADARRDFRHKATTDLANSHGLVAVEALDVKNMTKSARGTAEEPGRNVRQKAGLNRSILEVGWGDMRRMLRYKLEERGGELVEVDPAYTSQRCAACGHVSPGNRPSQASFRCERCGHEGNADTNAAINILAAGRAAAACGGADTAPAKQEPRAA